MQLKLIRHLWGVEKTWEQAFPLIKAEGFTGIEAPLPAPDQAQRFTGLLKEHGFDFIAMAFTGGKTVAEHVKSFREQLTRANELGATQLTAHTGADFWRRDEIDTFYREVVTIERDSRIAVGHETHRNRVFFNPWITRDVLEKFDTLKLCCDFSHWVCVAERLLDGCDDIINLCAQRCIHIHSRVGYAEGPQVPDPSAPEYANELNTHLRWWKTIWTAQKSRGVKVTTVTPEFGPPGYLHTLPHTNVPVADLWRVCKWMADRVAREFAG